MRLRVNPVMMGTFERLKPSVHVDGMQLCILGRSTVAMSWSPLN